MTWMTGEEKEIMEERFDGATYEAEHDEVRLSKQLSIVTGYMLTSGWKTLPEIAEATGISPTSASARLRDLRKEKHGAWTVERRLRGERKSGLYEYKLVAPPGLTEDQKAAMLGEWYALRVKPRTQVPTSPTVAAPTDAQLQAFVAWLRPIYNQYSRMGPVPSDVLPVCKWLADGAKR